MELEDTTMKLVRYYTTCDGGTAGNPFAATVGNLSDAFSLLNETAVDLKKTQFCDATSMNAISTTAGDTSATLDAILGAVSCRALNAVFVGLVHDSLCGPFLWGVYM